MSKIKGFINGIKDGFEIAFILLITLVAVVLLALSGYKGEWEDDDYEY